MKATRLEIGTILIGNFYKFVVTKLDKSADAVYFNVTHLSSGRISAVNRQHSLSLASRDNWRDVIHPTTVKTCQ